MARDKLLKYYSSIDFDHRTLYNLATILELVLKLEVYNKSSFGRKWLDNYEQEICHKFVKAYTSTVEIQSVTSDRPSALPRFSMLGLGFLWYWHYTAASSRSEIHSYLGSSAEYCDNFLQYWRVHEAEYPILAHLA